MVEGITRYEGKVEKLIIAKGLHSISKNRPNCVKVSSTNIVVSGKNKPLRPIQPGGIHNDWNSETDWDLTIPLPCVRNVFFQSYKAEGVMNYHKEVIGVEATIDGSLMNYAIFDRNPDELFKVIQESRNDRPM